jgi:hypothetical protein
MHRRWTLQNWIINPDTSAATEASSLESSIVNIDRIMTVGGRMSMGSISPSQEFAVVFEDDGESAHFYALNAFRNDRRILDVVNTYTVEQVSDCETPCKVRISWSNDGSKVILIIDEYPHAVFDFQEKQGYCRTNYPNIPRRESDSWRSDDHRWSDSVLQWFR